MVGDIIQSRTVHGGVALELQVCAVKFTQDEADGEVKMRVELHLPSGRFETIGAFEKWYKEL